MMNNMNLVVKDLCKSYKEKEVIKDLNLTLEPGKIYGLIGRNGAGKTTLLSVMAAHAKATSGSVCLGNEPVWENQKALDCICFSRELEGTSTVNTNLVAMKVKDYLKAASEYFPKWDGNLAEDLLKEFELDKKQRLNKLSKGMLSMVTIIVALASKADYTFLDEPVAGLDVVARDRFYKILLDEYTKSGRTFVISTHIIDEAADVMEEVIILKNGKIMMKENTQELLQRSYYVSGKEEVVEEAVKGLSTYHREHFGRSLGLVVVLEEGKMLEESPEIDIQPVNLQKLFVALCGKEGA